MKKSKTAKIIEHIAAEHGVSVSEIRRDMEEALEAGYESRDKDEYARTFWGQWNGRKPTLEEFITATAKEAKQKPKSD